MTTRTIACLVAAAMAACIGGEASAGDAGAGSNAAPPPAPRETDSDIYGWRLMTHAERDAYRARLGTARSPTQRERWLREHASAMQARARERGVRLAPPAEADRRDAQGGSTVRRSGEPARASGRGATDRGMEAAERGAGD